MNKLKDVAGLLKAKITKDELQQALINSTSEENWQTSTHILHEIANAAFNYEKCQQINQFIWDKLKKPKSWRKILKTLNLVEFLLKNGPPSIINSYKYDIYQFRSFDSYTHYDEGIDRGQPIREKAKLVVDLLSNEQLLQEQRLKAKTIREKMSGVVGGSNYGGFNANSGAKYGSIDNKSYSTGGYSSSNNAPNWNEPSGLGTYGDYNYNKSTLDKYKDNKTTSSTTQNKPSTSVATNQKIQEQKETVLDNKKPFQKVANKLVKPGTKPPPKPNTTAPNNQTSNNDNIIDILGDQQPIQSQNSFNKPQLSQQTQPIQQPAQQPQQQQQNNLNQFGFQQTTQPQNQQNQQFQQQNQQFNVINQNQQQSQNLLYNQPPQNPQQHQQISNNNNIMNNTLLGMNLGMNQPNQVQPNLYGQQPVQNNQFGQQQQQQQQSNLYNNGYNMQQSNQLYFNQQQNNNTFNQQNNQQPNMYGQQANFGYQNNIYQQPIQQNVNQGYNQQNLGFNQNQQQMNWNLQQSQPQSQSTNVNLSSGITLSTNQPKKDEDEFGTFSSGQNNNVKWLSNQEKGLIDFSDFGEEIKKDNKQGAKQSGSKNNIDLTWNW